MEFRILGPLEVVDGSGVVRLGEGRQRPVLLLLLLHRNTTVSSERLIDALWGERPPPTAAKVLQNHIRQLRRAFGEQEAERLATRDRGYALRVEPGELDLDRFEALVKAGGAALEREQPHEASELLREALALWRGPPLADAAYESFAQPEIGRLEERRLLAQERRVDAELALGRHAEMVVELEALVAEHPLRERPRCQLMLALYRSGRQAEALEAYQDARAALVQELGMEPGPALRELQEAILRQDPALAPGPASWPALRRHSPRARALLALGGALLLLSAVTATLLIERRRSTTVREPVTLNAAENSIAGLRAGSGRIEFGLPLPGKPVGVAAIGDTAVVATRDSRALVVVDAASHAIVRTVPLRVDPGAVAVHGDDVWVAASRRGTVTQYRLGYEQEVARQTWPREGRGPTAVAFHAGRLWVSDGSRRLWRIDLRTGASEPLDAGVPLGGLVAGAGAVWAFSPKSAMVVRVDPATGEITPIPIATRGGSAAPAPIGMASTSRAVWALNANTATVARVDAEQGGVTGTVEIGIDRLPRAIASAEETVWVANSDGTLSRIAADGRTVSSVWVGAALAAIALAGDRLWLATRKLDRRLPGGQS